MLFPFLAIGQTKLSQLPTVSPDNNTLLVGLKNIGGVNTDYYFTIAQLATYINSGTGGLTSVGLSMPGVFSVSPTTLTSGGTFSVVAAGGQPANKFYATPNGTAGALALRSIASADLPLIGTPGTYGDATHIPAITTDVYGRAQVAGTYFLSGGEAAADHMGYTSTTGTPMYVATSTTTVIVYAYLNITSIVTDVLSLQIVWTDENGNPQVYGVASYSTVGYHSVPPLTLRIKAGSYVSFSTGLPVSSGSISYDAGWKVLY